jgi:dCTP deaminase
MLSDKEIKKEIEQGTIGFDPYDPENIQPASIDMTLDRYFRWYPSNEIDVLDLKSPARRTISYTVSENDSFTIKPNGLVLASTIERIRLPVWLGARAEGKSSLGRVGLFIHVTAGFIDPGWDGNITLELFNANHLPIRIYPGMKICQMSFHPLSGRCAHPYGSKGLNSKYQNAEPGPTESMYYKNFVSVSAS